MLKDMVSLAVLKEKLADDKISNAKIKQKMLEKNYPERLIDEALANYDIMETEGQAEVSLFLAKKYCKKGKGNLWIERDLRGRDISQNYIDAAIAQLPSEDERAIMPAREKAAKVSASDKRQKISKIASFLSGRGFSSDVCWKAATEATDHVES